ncbi:SCO family protein [Pseudaquabacterium pictum]|nr:SCO family protein [Rubrivivax pictus]
MRPLFRSAAAWRHALCTTACLTALLAAGQAGAHADHANTAPPPPPSAADLATPLRIHVPDVTVTDQFNRQHRLSRDLVQGRTVLVNFVFTSCTTVCSPMTAVLKSVQDELRRQGRQDVLLLSVSVDPLTDSPQTLAGFAAKFGIQNGWHFLTGARTAIDAVLKGFGLPTGGAIDDHTPMVYIADGKTGRWSRAYGLAGPQAILQRLPGAGGKSGGATSGPLPPQRAAWSAPVAVPHGLLHRVASNAAPAPAASAALPPAWRPLQRLAGEQTRSASPVVLATGKDGAAGHFTNLPVLTQDRGRVRFYDDLIKGRVVLVSAFFTQCRDVCSPVTHNLVQAQQLLAGELKTPVQLVSISVDPVADTPEVLEAYARRHGAGPGWSFVTGKKENVDWVLHRLGLYVPEKEQHLAVLWAGNDRTGAWLKLHALAPPEAIAAAVRKLL